MSKFQDKEKKGKLSKKQKRMIIILVLVVALIFASIYTVAIRPALNQVKVTYEATTVNRGSVIVTVNESGSIEYEQSQMKYDLNLDVSDDDDDDDDDEEEVTSRYLVIEDIYKASGELIHSGDQLLKFDENSIVSVRKLLAAAVAEAQVDYNDAKNTYELSALEAEVTYKSTLINAEYAKKTYSKTSAQVTDNISAIQADITHKESLTADLQEAITEAQEDYDEAYSAYMEAKSVYENVDPNNANQLVTYQKLYIQAQNKYTNALTALENAQTRLSDNTKEIADLKTKLSSAKASQKIDSGSATSDYEETVQSGENAYLVYIAKMESLEEDLKEAEEKLKKREKQQEDFENLVGEDGIVYATEEGLLVSINVETAEELTNSKTMLSYVTSDALTISVDVTEEDIVSLAIGQHVDIVFTAYPDETFDGVITSINTTATSSNTNTVSYPVVIKLEGDLTRMYGGMTASVSFKVDSSEDTLYISRKALVEQNGLYYVYVKSDLTDYELKPVTIGLKNTSYVEILSGLSENDKIYIATTEN